MTEWWDGLRLIEQVLYCIAIPATLILVLQAVMEIIGLDFGGDGVNLSDTSGLDLDFDVDVPDGLSGDISGDMDVPGDGQMSDSGAMKFFSLQGIVAFLSIFGWSAIVVLRSGGSETASILIGLICGFIAMYIVAKVMQLSAKLAYNGTLDIRNALGESGRVYLMIPPKGEGSGKVNIVVQGRFLEFDALNNSSEPIKTGETVRVVDIEADQLVVEKE